MSQRYPTWLFYAAGGVGKTLLSSGIPGAVVIDGEGGAGGCKAPLVYCEKGRSMPRSWKEYLGLLTKIEKDKALPHNGRALVIDGAGRLINELGMDHVFANNQNKKGEAFTSPSDDYFAPVTLLLMQVRIMLRALESINEFASIVMTAHEKIITEKDPELAGEKSQGERITLDFYGVKSANIGSRLFQWFDVVGWLNEQKAKTGEIGAGKFAQPIITSNGQRILSVRNVGGAFEAGTRNGFGHLDSDIAIPLVGGWGVIQRQLDAGPPPWPTIEALRTEGAELIAKLTDEKMKAERTAWLANKELTGRDAVSTVAKWRREKNG